MRRTIGVRDLLLQQAVLHDAEVLVLSEAVGVIAVLVLSEAAPCRAVPHGAEPRALTGKCRRAGRCPGGVLVVIGVLVVSETTAMTGVRGGAGVRG